MLVWGKEECLKMTFESLKGKINVLEIVGQRVPGCGTGVGKQHYHSHTHENNTETYAYSCSNTTENSAEDLASGGAHILSSTWGSKIWSFATVCVCVYMLPNNANTAATVQTVNSVTASVCQVICSLPLL